MLVDAITSQCSDHVTFERMNEKMTQVNKNFVVSYKKHFRDLTYSNQLTKFHM